MVDLFISPGSLVPSDLFCELSRYFGGWENGVVSLHLTEGGLYGKPRIQCRVASQEPDRREGPGVGQEAYNSLVMLPREQELIILIIP
jgi:hypothetical protein